MPVDRAVELRVGDRTVLALSDGRFAMPPDFLGSDAEPTGAHDLLAGADGGVTLPVGCFLIPGPPTVLVDLGVGPRELGGDGWLVGGALLDGLAAHGVAPADVDLVALTHLHGDHIGFLASAQGDPVFPRATVAVARADHASVRDGDGAAEPHVQRALAALAAADRLLLLDGEEAIAPGITRLPAPGHTPGHSAWVVAGGGERLVLLGDAMYVPEQLAHPDWRAWSDADPAQAGRTRAALLELLAQDGVLGLGAHFPGLRPGRVSDGAWAAA